MKDAYSFDADEEGAAESYETHAPGLRAHLRPHGPDLPHGRGRLRAPSAARRAPSSRCSSTRARTRSSRATSATTPRTSRRPSASGRRRRPTRSRRAQPEKVAHARRSARSTRSRRSSAVDEEARRSSRSSTSSRTVRAPRQVVMVVVRGDHERQRVRARARARRRRGVPRERRRRRARGDRRKVGLRGPGRLRRARIFVDRDAAAVRGGVAGANETDHHLKDVVVRPRLPRARSSTCASSTTGDPLPELRRGTLDALPGIEAGHIFILGTKYSRADGRDLHRREAAAAAARHGLLRHRRLAPRRDDHRAAPRRQRHPLADERRAVPRAPRDARQGRGRRSRPRAKLYDELEKAGVEVLWDDRDERPGVKFKDADLIGIPLRVTIGAKGLAAGQRRAQAAHRDRPEEGRARPPRRRRPRSSPSGSRALAGLAPRRGLNGAPSRATNDERCPASTACPRLRPCRCARPPSRWRARPRSAVAGLARRAVDRRPASMRRRAPCARS